MTNISDKVKSIKDQSFNDMIEREGVNPQTEINYLKLYDRVAWEISELFDDQNVDRTQAGFMLAEYEMTEGEDGVKALFGFMRYCALHPEDERFTEIARKGMFAHDLNGAGKSGFLPRTSGYLKFWND